MNAPVKFLDQRKAVQDQRKRILRSAFNDAVGWARSKRMDDQQAVFVGHLVLQTLAEVERHEYPEAKWVNGGLISIESSINEAADEFGWYEQGTTAPTGLPLLADDADDLPLVGITGKYNTERLHTYGAAFRYTTQELKKASWMRSNSGVAIDIIGDKAAACREKLDRDLNQVIAFGVPEMGIKGLFNHPEIEVRKSDVDWLDDSTTIDALIEAMRSYINVPRLSTETVETPDTVTMPLEVQSILQTRYIDALDLTLEERLAKAFPFIKKWEWTKENDTGGAGDPCFLIYRNDRSRVRCEQPRRPSPEPLRDEGRRFLQELTGRVGPVVVKRPKSIVRIDLTDTTLS